jgi:hypothetical protein
VHCTAVTAADVVPGWMVGADPLRGTVKVVQPFGDGASILTAAGAGTAAVAAAAGQGSASACRPGNSRGGRCSPVCERPANANTSCMRRRPASAGPCCGGGSSSSSSAAAVALVAPAAMKVVGCRWGPGGAASVLSTPGGSGGCISSQWLCTGMDDGDDFCHRGSYGQEHEWQQKARPRSAAAALTRQRPASALGHAASASRSSSKGSCLRAQPQEQQISRPATAAAGCAASPVAGAARTVTCEGTGLHSSCSVIGLVERPSSCPPRSLGGAVGLAEQRRLAESMRQDLTAVRLLQ